MGVLLFKNTIKLVEEKLKTTPVATENPKWSIILSMKVSLLFAIHQARSEGVATRGGGHGPPARQKSESFG